MRKVSERQLDSLGNEIHIPKDMKKLLNLNFLKWLNKTGRIGKYDLPYLYCYTEIFPDYIALDNEPGLYHHTFQTCVSFYNYDNEFDGIHGLYNAIYFGDEKLLTKYKKRYQDVNFFITPDYSVCGDVHHLENLYRIWKSRIVGIWLSLVMGAVVIPNIMYYSEEYFDESIAGLEECSVVAFSTKGHMRNPQERQLTRKMIKYTVDHLHNLKAIVVYSVCGNGNDIYKLFEYATLQGVSVIIPRNSLQVRNAGRRHCG